MEKSTKTKSNSVKKSHRPSATLNGRENQMIALAMDVAEKQLREGTASSQVITHFLKLGTEQARLEKAKLENETALLKAKRENLQSQARMEELYAKAVDSMRLYSGQSICEDENDDEEY